MSKPVKVVHISSAHKDGDARIFHKMCVGLAANNYDVSLVIANGISRVENGVKIVAVNSVKRTRFGRALSTVNSVFEKALELNADIYHLHDPELLRISGRLKKHGKKVVYDAHEDLPRQILSKEYIPMFLRSTLSRAVERYENRKVKEVDAVVAATPFIRDRFLKLNTQTIDINNYPILGELTPINDTLDNVSDRSFVCYVGGISRSRGIKEAVNALVYNDYRLILAGEFFEPGYDEILHKTPGWDKVDYLGFVNRSEVSSIYNRSFAGLVTLKPTVNYLDSLPVKMFEYMAAGIPVIASDFPLWRKVLADYECAIFVDPSKPDQIAAAINELKTNTSLSKRFSENGRKAVREKYNWHVELNKLLKLYENLSGKS